MAEVDLSRVAEVEPVRRVFGIESELLTPHVLASEPNLYDFPSRFGGQHRVKQFLSNGARFYKDVGEHVEYATPECRTIREAVAALIAGETVMTSIADGVRQELGGQAAMFCNSAFNTRVIDSEGHTWGSHESYLTRRDINPAHEAVYQPLASFLATRSVLAGVGCVRRYRGKVDFSIAQKIWGIRHEVGSGTTCENKTLVNTRDEPHADAGEYRRLHLIMGDPTQSPWATAYRLGSTSLVLRMLEHGVNLNRLTFSRPLEAARIAGSFSNLQREIQLRKGGKITPLEHQLAFAEIAMQLVKDIVVSDEERLIAQEWYSAAKDLAETKDHASIADKVDWAMKFSLMSRATERKRKPRIDVVTALDHLYGELSVRGLAAKLRNKGTLQDPLGAMEIAPDLVLTPPEGRARLRGDMVKKLSKLARRALCEEADANWSHVVWKIQDTPRSWVDMRNPFGDDKDEIEEVQKCLVQLDKLIA